MDIQELKMKKLTLENTKSNLEGLMEEITPNLENMSKLSHLRGSIEIIEDKLKEVRLQMGQK